jgi:hypothetical protein
MVTGQTGRLEVGLANVRFGSKADMEAGPCNVRFTPKSGHSLSVSACPLCANSGLMQCSKMPVMRTCVPEIVLNLTWRGSYCPLLRAAWYCSGDVTFIFETDAA